MVSNSIAERNYVVRRWLEIAQMLSYGNRGSESSAQG